MNDTDDIFFTALALASLGILVVRNTAIGSTLIAAGGARIVLASPRLALTIPVAVLMVHERVRQHPTIADHDLLEMQTAQQAFAGLTSCIADSIGDGIEVATVPLLPGYDLIARGVNQIRG